MLELFEEFELTENNFRQWKHIHCPGETGGCEDCLHCVAGIAEAFRKAPNLQSFLWVSEHVIAHASDYPSTQNTPPESSSE